MVTLLYYLVIIIHSMENSSCQFTERILATRFYASILYTKVKAGAQDLEDREKYSSLKDQDIIISLA